MITECSAKCARNDKICHKEGVVYKILCEKCKNFYLGSATRKLHHMRITEHLKDKRLSVLKHLQPSVIHINRYRCQFLSIIHNDPINLRFREAMAIKISQPNINAKEELSDYQHLII